METEDLQAKRRGNVAQAQRIGFSEVARIFFKGEWGQLQGVIACGSGVFTDFFKGPISRVGFVTNRKAHRALRLDCTGGNVNQAFGVKSLWCRARYPKIGHQTLQD